MKVLTFLLAAALAGPAQADGASFTFAWQGAGGYAMTGAMSFDPALIGRRMVREQDVSCFVIEGTRDGSPIGRWMLGMLGPDTSWRLFFDPEAPAFVVEGQGVRMPQAWNMNGAGDDCGIGGFGFNLGNLGQDFCLDNRTVAASRIAPEVPFPATRDDGYVFPRGACTGPDLLSLGPSGPVLPGG